MYVGMEIHKNYCCVVGLGEKGDEEVLPYRRIPAAIDEIEKFAGSLPWDSEVVMEASSTWEYIYDRLEPKVRKVCLSHPLKTRAIAEARIKTDKVDALTLAKLLRADFLPESYVPPKEVRELRRLARHRMSLTKIQTFIKNRVHGLLMRNGLNPEFTDIFGKGGLQYLEKLLEQLTEVDKLILTSLLKSFKAMNKEILEVTSRIAKVAKGLKDVELVMSVPGIDFYSALIILSEIGDVNRFPSYKKLCAYSGLVPSTHQSGKTRWNGHITKQGNKWLRWILIQVVQHVTKREGGRMRNFYLRLTAKKGKKVARVACARKLLRVIYCMLTRGEKYLEGSEQLLKAKIRKMNKKAAEGEEYQTLNTTDMRAFIESLISDDIET